MLCVRIFLNRLTNISVLADMDLVDMDTKKESTVPSVRDLPPGVMVEVFANLSLRDLLRCQQVCMIRSHIYTSTPAVRTMGNRDRRKMDRNDKRDSQWELVVASI